MFFGFGALTGDGGVVRTGWAVGTGEMAHGVWYTVYGGVAERVMTRCGWSIGTVASIFPYNLIPCISLISRSVFLKQPLPCIPRIPRLFLSFSPLTLRREDFHAYCA